MNNKKWLLRNRDKEKVNIPGYLSLDNQEEAFSGPLSDQSLSQKRNEINTGVGSNDVTPNPDAYTRV